MPVVGSVEDKGRKEEEHGKEGVAAWHYKGEEDAHNRVLAAAQEAYSKEFGKKERALSETLFAAANWVLEFDGALQLEGMDQRSCDPES